MTHYQIQYWHTIPVLVRAKEGRERVSAQLPQRFMDSVDSAAMAAGLVGTDDYLNAFRWSEPVERAGTPHDVAHAVAAELDMRTPEIDWRGTADQLKNTG